MAVKFVKTARTPRVIATWPTSRPAARRTMRRPRVNSPTSQSMPRPVVDQQPAKKKRLAPAVKRRIEKGAEAAGLPRGPGERPVQQVEGSRKQHQHRTPREMASAEHEARQAVEQEPDQGEKVRRHAEAAQQRDERRNQATRRLLLPSR